MNSEQKQATLDAIKDLINAKQAGQGGGGQGGPQPKDDPRLNKPKPESKDTEDNSNSRRFYDNDAYDKDINEINEVYKEIMKKYENENKEKNNTTLSQSKDTEDNSNSSSSKGGGSQSKEKEQSGKSTGKKQGPQIGDKGDPETQAKEAAERAKKIEEESKEAAKSAGEAGEDKLKDKNKELAKAAGEIGDQAEDLGDDLEDGDASEAEKARLQKIQDKLNDLESRRKALDETERAIFTSSQLEADKKRRREWEDNPGQRFLHSVYRFIKDEVDSVKMGSWKRPDKRYANTSIIHKGKAVNHNAPIPSLVVYFDRSGSIGQEEVNLCNQAIASLKQFEKRGELKIKVYYFADNVDSDPSKVGGATGATQLILDHAKRINANNIIILTDDDMDSQGAFTKPLTVPGAVWFLFAKGRRCYKIMQYLHGKAMTKVYDLK